jgi:hypothetical protein
MNEEIGNNTMFIPDPYDPAAWAKECLDKYGLTPDFQWPLLEFGGINDVKEDFKFYSNIIFSNGSFDP